MTPKQRKRLMRNHANGNKLFHLKMRVVCKRVSERMCDWIGKRIQAEAVRTLERVHKINEDLLNLIADGLTTQTT